MASRKKTPTQRLDALAMSVFEQAPFIEDLLGGEFVPREKKADNPRRRARQIAVSTAARVAMVSGGLALTKGTWRWLAAGPDLVAIWRLQSQMVADIAGAYGRKAAMSPGAIARCLALHGAAHATREVALTGLRSFVVRQALPGFARKSRLSQRFAMVRWRKSTSRWLPLTGAVGTGAFAALDTMYVARRAIASHAK